MDGVLSSITLGYNVLAFVLPNLVVVMSNVVTQLLDLPGVIQGHYLFSSVSVIENFCLTIHYVLLVTGEFLTFYCDWILFVEVTEYGIFTFEVDGVITFSYASHLVRGTLLA